MEKNKKIKKKILNSWSSNAITKTNSAFPACTEIAWRPAMAPQKSPVLPVFLWSQQGCCVKSKQLCAQSLSSDADLMAS